MLETIEIRWFQAFFIRVHICTLKIYPKSILPGANRHPKYAVSYRTAFTLLVKTRIFKGGYPNEGDLVDIEQRDDGVTAAETVAEARVYAGFTAQSFAQETIAPDDSTVVEIRYSRNSYPINWVVDGETTTEQVKYGAEIVTPQPPAKQGYIFERWLGFDEGMTMGTDGQTFTARWKPAPDTGYTVKHILQDLDESYPAEGDLVKNEVKTGATGSQTAAAPKNYEGFTPGPVTQAEILPDGTTVVEILYGRNSISKMLWAISTPKSAGMK
ncbi:InlB B-repeat-containing protein [Bacteroides thetaiotaomicron]|nr:InlB B-repeat-containing protein [Bacteroides thetaiotaomicron]